MFVSGRLDEVSRVKTRMEKKKEKKTKKYLLTFWSERMAKLTIKNVQKQQQSMFIIMNHFLITGMLLKK